jgi:hypothetical protein
MNNIRAAEVQDASTTIPTIVAGIINKICTNAGIKCNGMEKISDKKSDKTLLEFLGNKPLYLTTQSGTFRMPVHTDMNKVKDLSTKTIDALSHHFTIKIYQEKTSSCIPPYTRGPIYELLQKQ